MAKAFNIPGAFVVLEEIQYVRISGFSLYIYLRGTKLPLCADYSSVGTAETKFKELQSAYEQNAQRRVK